MKTAMIYPTRESEKAISGYSTNLVKALKENGIDADEITYDAGKPMAFFRQFTKFKKYDIIHLQHEYNLLGWYGIPFFFVYLYLILPQKYKVITTMHTALSQKENFVGSKLKTFLRKILYKTQNMFIRLASDLVFVHSDFFVPVLMNEYNFSREKLIILPQGIISGIKTIQKNKAKKELGISGNMFLIIGNLTADSGPDIILKYAKEIGKTIVIVSNPKSINKMMNQKRLDNYLDFLVNYVKKKELSKYVRFDIAPINDTMPKWWTYFSAADFVLLAYRGGIGSGIFTHAMATKTPVIASNIAFFKDISKKYSCLKIAENEKDYSKIIKESLKPKNYKRMLDGCERYAKENSWIAVAKKYKEVYSSLLK
jgi:glycosyltransferase involved in cell wall biosynthesis